MNLVRFGKQFRPLAWCAVALAFALPGCVALDEDAPESSETFASGAELNIRRSLVVTNKSILGGFTMRRVLDQLAGELLPGYSGATLYRDWWDTQNDAAHGQGGPVHCSPSLNSYPMACPRQEGLLAAVGLFDHGPDSWIPIGLFNRFDLAPADGANCGEYRIELGKQPRFFIGAVDRVLVIFEAQMPNPDPDRGRDGCDSIVDFWASLSLVEAPAARAALLEEFYFTGLVVDHDRDPATPDVQLPPVVSAAHFAAGTGQIRTNQFMNFRTYFERGILGQPWQLREFELQPGCPGDVCIAQVPVKSNPFGPLFADSTSHAQGPAFKDYFATAEVVGGLAGNDLNGLGIGVPLVFDTGESTQQGVDNDYVAHFDPAGPFAQRIGVVLASLAPPCAEGQPCAVPLTPRDIVQRATTQSCAGCHQLSVLDSLGGGLVWPSSLVFTHVSETALRECEPTPLQGLQSQGQCFVTSPALDSTFLPHRLSIMQAFLDP